jgi:transaldolase
MKSRNDLRIKLYVDGADKAGILDLYAKPYIKGLTTNPTLNSCILYLVGEAA